MMFIISKFFIFLFLSLAITVNIFSNKEYDIPDIEYLLNHPYEPINYSKLVDKAKKYLGSKYFWGGTTPRGFDCSGYMQYLYKKVGMTIPRTAFQQSKVGVSIDKKNLKKGDLLFFKTTDSRMIPITHVGMYIGDKKFIHAASKKKGIIISPINGKYKYNFVKAKRFL